jgi:hypothetical protein
MDVSYEERVGCAKPHTMLTKLSQEDQDKALRTRLNGKLKILYQDSRLSYPLKQEETFSDK